MALQLRSLWSLVGELNVPELRSAIERPIQVVVLGSVDHERRAVARVITGGASAAGAIREVPLLGEPGTPRPAADIYLVVTAGRTPAESADVQNLAKGSIPVVLLLTNRSIAQAGGTTDSPVPAPAKVLDLDLDDPEDCRRRLAGVLMSLLGSRALAVARRCSGMREPVADRLIRDTSFANAQFALLSTLPNWIPLVGGLASASADLLVLTKNQVLLLLKLAGIYGRDLSQWRHILLEIAPVVGGAFLWRSVARTLVGLMPPPVAAAPKTAVAYVGTMTVGEIARRYYRDGVRIDSRTVHEAQVHALAAFHAVNSRLPMGRGEAGGQRHPVPPTT